MGDNAVCCYCIPSFVLFCWIHYLESKNLLLSHVHKHTPISLSELRLYILMILCTSEEHLFHIIKLYILPVATYCSLARVYFISILMLKGLLFVTPGVLIYCFASSIVFLIWCSFHIGNCDLFKYLLSWISINTRGLGIWKKTTQVIGTNSM